VSVFRTILVWLLRPLEWVTLIALFLGCTGCFGTFAVDLFGLGESKPIKNIIVWSGLCLLWGVLAGSFFWMVRPRQRLSGDLARDEAARRNRKPATAEEVEKLETSLGVRLPDVLRRELASPREPRGRRLADAPLTTDPDSLLRLNLRYRKQRASSSSPRLFCIGIDGGGMEFFVDPNDTPPIVYSSDRGEPPEEVAPPSDLDAWIQAQYDDELGIDVDPGSFREALVGWLLIWGGIVGIAIVIALTIFGCQTILS